MLVSKRRFLAAQDQTRRLQHELDEAHLSLTRTTSRNVSWSMPSSRRA